VRRFVTVGTADRTSWAGAERSAPVFVSVVASGIPGQKNKHYRTKWQ
jgi:hypothetical protein